ncbi:hypothetical protein J6590_076479 [Homalodisca vitripennis]|nr:hypothetical protein J6590_076479 [Homalodisca vitripennis]
MLSNLAKLNCNMRDGMEALRDDLSTAEGRCTSLNDSYKVKDVECCEIEEQSDAEIRKLSTQLVQCKEENARLQRRVVNSEVDPGESREDRHAGSGTPGPPDFVRGAGGGSQVCPGRVETSRVAGEATADFCK